MVLILAGGIFLCVKLYRAPDKSIPNNPQLVEQIAMDAAKEFFENKKFFLEYEPSEPMHNDSIFMDKIKLPWSNIKDQKVILYPVSYSVKIVHSIRDLWWNKSDVNVSCEARVFSIVNKYRELNSMGLVFSEPIKNKEADNGVMTKDYSRDWGNAGIIFIVGGILFFIYARFYAEIIGTYLYD
jgi:hypothetical protein